MEKARFCIQVEIFMKVFVEDNWELVCIRECADHQANGRGVYFYAEGAKYEGQWKNDAFDVYGILIDSDGSRHGGDFKEGKQHGKGQWIWDTSNVKAK